MGATKLSRRELLKQAGIGTGVLVLGVHVAPKALFADPETSPVEGPFAPNVFLSIDVDGTVTLVAHRSEMGQGIRTGLPAVIADELEADWRRVRVVQADGDEKYIDQDTDGSRSVRQFFRPLRQAGATARQMLVAAAAALWAVPAAECEAREHRVWHRPSGRSLDYGELVSHAAKLPVPAAETLELKPRSAFRYIGKPLPGVDLDAMVTGRAAYGADLKLPGMLVASVEHCPVVGGSLRSFDAPAALAVPGVRKVVPIDGKGGLGGGFQPLPGVAVLADTTWAALRGRAALAAQWDAGPNGSYDTEAYAAELEATAGRPGKVVRHAGDVDAALAGAAKVVEAVYHVPHLAQAPMEPPAALARCADGRCEIWAPTQSPVTVQGEVGKALQIDPKQVTVHVTFLGGAFGRKSKPDFIIEAALLAREAGVPVRVQWTREDDLRAGYYHAISCQSMKGGLDAEGRPVAWRARTVFPSISATFNGTAKEPSTGELGLGFVDLPFAVPNLRLESGEATAHVRIGWMRSVANIHHAFAADSFADELAHAAGRDPKDFLLELLGPPRQLDPATEEAEYRNYGEPLHEYPIDTARLRHVVELAAQQAGWGRQLPAGHGLGIAVHRSFVTYVAAVVEASAGAAGEPVVHAVDLAVDCGTIVNPDRVKAQMEGAAIYALSIALYGEISAEDGAIVQSNFDDYPILRTTACPPKIAVHLVESDAPPGGVGEPGVPPVAPALANALFAATGKRHRRLPIVRRA